MSRYSSYWGDDDDYTSEYDSYGSYGYGYGSRVVLKKKKSTTHIHGNQAYGQITLGV
jgi:hypothetical protein